MKKVGVIGSGGVGQSLATGFLKYGYDTMIGSHHTAKLAEWHEKNPAGHVGTFEEAAKFGDIIVYAVRGVAAVEVLKSIGADNFSGKTVIDTTNPIDADVHAINGVVQFFTPKNQSLLEDLQAAAPGANFVKAFNSIGAHLMVNPDFGGNVPSMFICGNNEGAKKEATEIIEKFGFEALDMGPANAASPIESLCVLWCIPGYQLNRWHHAFKLLRPQH